MCPAGSFPAPANAASPHLNLVPVMPLDALYRLPQAPRPAMPVVRVGQPVLVEYDAVARFRILRVMDIPDMPGIL